MDFTDKEDFETIRQLSIISGEISTGKTTVLEFIDWCLGAKEHPEHDEVLANVRSAQLAIDVHVPGTDKPARYVIERGLGPRSTKAFLYAGDFNEFSVAPVRSFSAEPSDTESLSYYLLQLCGLSGLRLDQSPTKEDSKTSVLSFRDLQPLWYLGNRRLDNGDLALERQPHKSIKLNQVVNLLFGVSDNEQSNLSRAVEELGAEERELARAVQTLKLFMADAGLTSLEETETEADKLRTVIIGLTAELHGIDANMAANGAFAQEQRSEFEQFERESQQIQSKLRDRSALSDRLDSLRSQYADEIRRLDLVVESVTLFDSLALVECPVCHSDLSASASVVAHQCSLCNSPLEKQPDGEESRWDLTAERRSLARRLNQLLEFIREVRGEEAALRVRLRESDERVRAAQAGLDFISADVVSPFLTQRDSIQRALGEARGNLQAKVGARQMFVQLRQKEMELFRTAAALKEARSRKARYLQAATPRDSMLEAISKRFTSILVDFGYPKVNEAYVDRSLVPIVRGRRYDKVGSSGAMTLIAIAWELSIFELAFEEGAGHPGFLVLDSPQKNLVPGVINRAAASSRDGDAAEISEYIAGQRRNIVENIYRHVTAWLQAHPGGQIVFVDNQPPSMADQNIVVHFSQNPDEPPYGLIDNEDGRESASSVV